jgi:hypothetical protein
MMYLSIARFDPILIKGSLHTSMNQAKLSTSKKCLTRSVGQGINHIYLQVEDMFHRQNVPKDTESQRD